MPSPFQHDRKRLSLPKAIGSFLKALIPRRTTTHSTNTAIEADCCSCSSGEPVPLPQPGAAQQLKKTARSIPSVLLSILVAFFPKCPFCWAAYMSMFGSFGLAQIPYQSWLFPVLLGFLGLHLLLIYRRVPEKGYGPLILSIAGVAILMLSRSLLPDSMPLLATGLLFILAGSLWNNFSFDFTKTPIVN